MADLLHDFFCSIPFNLWSQPNRKVYLWKWSYFKAKLSLYQAYEYKQCSTSNGDNILDRIHNGDSDWGMGRGGSIRQLYANNTYIVKKIK